jgi:hypothetical protein
VLLALNIFRSSDLVTRYIGNIAQQICGCCTPSRRAIFACYRKQSDVSNTRWFKYDRDKLWLVYTQIVPVIFEPPCITKRDSETNIMNQGKRKLWSYVKHEQWKEHTGDAFWSVGIQLGKLKWASIIFGSIRKEGRKQRAASLHWMSSMLPASAVIMLLYFRQAKHIVI